MGASVLLLSSAFGNRDRREPSPIEEYGMHAKHSRGNLACSSLPIVLGVMALVMSLNVSAHAGDEVLLVSKQINLREALELTASMVRRGDLSAARANIERVDHSWDNDERTDTGDALAERIADRAIDHGLDRVCMTLHERRAGVARSDRALSDLLAALDVVKR
jgi:hypothetical protein